LHDELVLLLDAEISRPESLAQRLRNHHFPETTILDVTCGKGLEIRLASAVDTIEDVAMDAHFPAEPSRILWSRKSVRSLVEGLFGLIERDDMAAEPLAAPNPFLDSREPLA
jgi:hypothetical protein